MTVGVLVQGEAADELHGEVRPALLRHAGLVDLCDARVVQPALELRLLGEALQERRRQEARADDLKGDRAARVVLLGLVDDAHAAFAQAAQDAVGADPGGEPGSDLRRVPVRDTGRVRLPE